MKTILMTFLVSALLVVFGGAVFIYSGVYDISAMTPHNTLSKWAFATTMHASVERRATEIEVPDLQDETLKLAGVNDFEEMCVGCHGAPGKKPGPVGEGLNPSAPDLAESAAHMSSAELFWVTKHGIKMTGMPAWGTTHEDEALWPVVALLTVLPDLNAETYAGLLERAKGMGHHANNATDHDHAHDADDLNLGADDPGGHDHGAPAQPENEPEHEHEHHTDAH